MEGEILIEAGTRKYLLHKGDGFFINSGVMHAVKNGASGKPAMLRSMVFHGSIVGGMAGSIYEQLYITPIIQQRKMEECMFYTAHSADRTMILYMQEAWEAMCAERDDYVLVVREKLSRIFALLSRRNRTGESSETTGDHVRENRVRMMLEFMHRKYAEEIVLGDIAADASISVSEALRCFKQVIGLSPMQYLKKYRLSRAANLLRENQYPVSVICAQCGFQDSSYFSKSFREVYHCSPIVFRMRAGNGEEPG